MGVYDTFHSSDGSIAVQLKIGPCELNNYRIGDQLPMGEFEEGIFVSSEGVVVINSTGVVVAIYGDLHTKWGDMLDLDEVLKLSPNNPYHVISALAGKYEAGDASDMT